jgi:hypothetical protein
MNYECVLYENDVIHSYNKMNARKKKYRNVKIEKIININDDMIYENKKPGRIILFFNKKINGVVINEPYLNIYFTSITSVKRYWKEHRDIRLKFDEEYIITGFLHTSRLGNDKEIEVELIDHMILE